MLRGAATLAALASLWSGTAIGPGPRENGGTGFWEPDLEAARRYARHRPGDVSFAIVGPHSRLRGMRKSRTAPAASTIKAMLLAAYLRRPAVRRRPLRAEDRALLEPMIRASDNAAATEVAEIVGARVGRLARAVRMRDFRWVWAPGWLGGLSQISARDQARFLFRYPRYLPKRHRRFARRLLGSIVPWQRWGIASARPPGWRLYFKGGWGIADDGVGVVNHQVAFLERGRCRIGLAILTEHNPSTADGAETQRGIAKRLLQGIRRAPCGRAQIPDRRSTRSLPSADEAQAATTKDCRDVVIRTGTGDVYTRTEELGPWDCLLPLFRRPVSLPRRAPLRTGSDDLRGRAGKELGIRTWLFLPACPQHHRQRSRSGWLVGHRLGRGGIYVEGTSSIVGVPMAQLLQRPHVRHSNIIL